MWLGFVFVGAENANVGLIALTIMTFIAFAYGVHVVMSIGIDRPRQPHCGHARAGGVESKNRCGDETKYGYRLRRRSKSAVLQGKHADAVW